MDWFETWFDTPYYHILYKNHDYSEAENFITKLIHYLQLPKGSKIIDLACGHGRHSVFLNKLGYDVLGLDLSKKNIEFDQQFENSTLKFRIQDMREPILDGKFDAVFNLFTSFGYFNTEEDDRKVFKNVSAVLLPDGYFVLDYLNQEYVRETLLPLDSVERDGITFNIRKKIEDNYVVKDINFRTDGRDFNYFERVKLHTQETIEAYAADYGLKKVKVWGDYNLSEFNEKESPRCIMLFKK